MDEFISEDSNTYPLSVNFAEIMTLENYLQNYQEELVEDKVAAIPINRPASFSKSLLLKVASTYVELYDNRNDLDKYSTMACTEAELWCLRQTIPPNVTFNNVSISPMLKKKILEGIISLNSIVLGTNEFSEEEDKSKYDVGGDIIEWLRQQNP